MLTPVLRRRLVAALLAGPLALLAGCDDDTVSAAGGPITAAPSTTTAAPTSSAPTGTVRPSGAATTTTVSTMPRPSATNSVLVRPAPGCSGCRVAGIRRDARPGISVALVVRDDAASSYPRQQAWLVSFRTTSGRELARLKVRAGDVFDPPLNQGADVDPTCDAIHHCFVAAGQGAHSGAINAILVSSSGALTDLLAEPLASASPAIEAIDLNGDGAAEIVALNSVGTPYSDGKAQWWIYQWRGGTYRLLGCSGVMIRETQPPRLPVNAAACAD